MNKKIILVVSIFLGSILSFGQDKDVPFNKDAFSHDKKGFSNAVKEIKLGDMHFFRGTDSDLSYALGHYMVADSFNHYSSDLNYKIGVCFLNSNQKFKGLEYLEFADKTKREGQFEDLDFYLAQAYQLDGNFDEAITRYQAYKGILGEKEKAQRYFINKKISGIKPSLNTELAFKKSNLIIDFTIPKCTYRSV